MDKIRQLYKEWQVLRQCDLLTGEIPYDGAHATLQQAKPLVDYISAILENKLTMLIQFAQGEIPKFIEAESDTVDKVVEKDNTPNVGVNVGVKNDILNNLKDNPSLTTQELATILNKTTRTIERNIRELRENGIISRVGSDKTGYWKVN